MVHGTKSRSLASIMKGQVLGGSGESGGCHMEHTSGASGSGECGGYMEHTSEGADGSGEWWIRSTTLKGGSTFFFTLECNFELARIMVHSKSVYGENYYICQTASV